jgi:hypothetical protein
VTAPSEDVCKRKHCLEVVVLGRTFLLQAAYVAPHTRRVCVCVVRSF